MCHIKKQVGEDNVCWQIINIKTKQQGHAGHVYISCFYWGPLALEEIGWEISKELKNKCDLNYTDQNIKQILSFILD